LSVTQAPAAALGAVVAKTQVVVSETYQAKSSSNSKGIDPRSIQNEILLSLPSREHAALLSELEYVEMRAHDLLNDAGEAIEFCYFMNSGMTSILTIMGDGKGVEVGLTGKE
jgi:CRP-like cAMP-binding protein